MCDDKTNQTFKVCVSVCADKLREDQIIHTHLVGSVCADVFIWAYICVRANIRACDVCMCACVFVLSPGLSSELGM